MERAIGGRLGICASIPIEVGDVHVVVEGRNVAGSGIGIALDRKSVV